MKIILTGPTGFIGAEVLRFALLHPAITAVVAISRRQLPTKHPKLTVVIQSDFLNYSNSTFQACAGAEACIWSLGVARSLSAEQNRKINLNYTLAAAKAFTEILAPSLEDGKKFRFVYLSGMMTERDPKRNLWFMKESRLIRVSDNEAWTPSLGALANVKLISEQGEVETALIRLEEEYEKSLLTYVARPGGVQPTNSLFPAMLQPLARAITVDDLAIKMLDTAINGHKTQILEVDILRDEGKALKKAFEEGEK